MGIIYTEKTLFEKRPEKTQKDNFLFIYHKQIDDNNPLNEIKETSVSVSVLSFFRVPVRDRHYCFHRSSDENHAEDDEKRDGKWFKNFSLLTVNSLYR